MSTVVKILPDPPSVCASNLRAEAALIEQVIMRTSGDPDLTNDDLRRIAKTVRRAAELLKSTPPQLTARAAAQAILCPNGWALPLGSGITTRTICDAIHAYHEASKSDAP